MRDCWGKNPLDYAKEYKNVNFIHLMLDEILVCPEEQKLAILKEYTLKEWLDAFYPCLVPLLLNSGFVTPTT